MEKKPFSEIDKFKDGYRIRCFPQEHYHFLLSRLHHEGRYSATSTSSRPLSLLSRKEHEGCYSVQYHGVNEYPDMDGYQFYIYIRGRKDMQVLSSDDGVYLKQLVAEANLREFDLAFALLVLKNTPGANLSRWKLTAEGESSKEEAEEQEQLEAEEDTSGIRPPYDSAAIGERTHFSEIDNFKDGYRIRCFPISHYHFLLDRIRHEGCYSVQYHGVNEYPDKDEFKFYIYIRGRKDMQVLSSDDGVYLNQLVAEANLIEFNLDHAISLLGNTPGANLSRWKPTEKGEGSSEEEERQEELEAEENTSGNRPPYDSAFIAEKAPTSEIVRYGRGYRIRCTNWDHYSFLYESTKEKDCYHYACHGNNRYKDKDEFPYYIFIDGRTDGLAIDSDYLIKLVAEVNLNKFKLAEESEGAEEEEEDEDASGTFPTYDPAATAATRDDLQTLSSDLIQKYDGLSQPLEAMDERMQQLAVQVATIRQEVAKELASLRRDSIDAQAKNHHAIQAWLEQTIQEVLLPAIRRLAGSQEEFHSLTSDMLQQLEESRVQSESSIQANTILALRDQVAELEEKLQQATDENEWIMAQIVAPPTKVSRPTEPYVDAPGALSLESLLRKIEEDNVAKVQVLSRALKSARDVAPFKFISPEIKDDLDSWLTSVPNTLHALLYDGSVGNIAHAYQAETGFELSLTESKATKADKRLMKLREVTIDGKTLFATAHIKFDRQNLCLRLHYVKHPTQDKIVVVHCGDHLPTAGSRHL